MSEIETRLKSIQKRIRAVTTRDVVLVAVSKKHSVASIREAYRCGQRDFGENYVDELVEKREALQDLTNLRFHFIGGVQSNKISTLNEVADIVHGACSLKHLQRLKVPSFAQVNIGEEEQKMGFEIEDLMGVSNEDSTPFLTGLMCIPPVDSPPRPYFQKMLELSNNMNKSRKISMPFLSMGMSSDFETAIECGATHIRVGTAIFGERT